ncbi:hypothetical protein KEM56_004798, partial [Ascosphaera pollenicola]
MSNQEARRRVYNEQGAQQQPSAIAEDQGLFVPLRLEQNSELEVKEAQQSSVPGVGDARLKTHDTIVAPTPRTKSSHAAESANREVSQYQNTTFIGVGHAQSHTHSHPATPTQGSILIRAIDDLVMGSPLREPSVDTPHHETSRDSLKRTRSSQGPNKRRLISQGSLTLRPIESLSQEAAVTAVREGRFSTMKEFKMVQAATARQQLDQQLQLRRAGPLRVSELGDYSDPSGIAIGDYVYTNLSDYAVDMLSYFSPEEFMERMKQEYKWYWIYRDHLEAVGTFNGLFMQFLARRQKVESDALLSFPEWHRRVNDRKNGIIRKMQCRMFMK